MLNYAFLTASKGNLNPQNQKKHKTISSQTCDFYTSQISRRIDTLMHFSFGQQLDNNVFHYRRDDKSA